LLKNLTATRSMRYARRDLRAGDTFKAPLVDADYLVRAGRAKPAVEEREQQPIQRGRPRQAVRAAQPPAQRTQVDASGEDDGE
jgi:hypothetical protein